MRHLLAVTAMALVLAAPATARALPFYLLLEGVTDEFVYDSDVKTNAGVRTDLDVYGARASFYFKNFIPLLPRLDPGVAAQYRNLAAEEDGVEFEAREFSFGPSLRFVPINILDLLQPYLLAEALVEYGDYKAAEDSDDDYEYSVQLGAGAMSELPGGLMLTAGVLYRAYEPDREIEVTEYEFDTRLSFTAGLGFAF